MRTSQLNKKLDEIRSVALDDFAEDVALKLQENIKTMWYDAYTPEDYERTYELLNAVDIKETKAGRQIYINEDSIVNGARQVDGGWTEHIGVNGERVDSFTDMLSENAMGDPLGGNKRLHSSSSDTDFYGETNKWVENNIKKEVLALVIKELGNNNIRAKVTTGKVANIKGNLQSGIRIKI